MSSKVKKERKHSKKLRMAPLATQIEQSELSAMGTLAPPKASTKKERQQSREKKPSSLPSISSSSSSSSHKKGAKSKDAFDDVTVGDDEEAVLDDKMSASILKQAREQQQEMEKDAFDDVTVGDDEEAVLDDKMSASILKQAREQQQEMEKEDTGEMAPSDLKSKKKQKPSIFLLAEGKEKHVADDDEEEDDETALYEAEQDEALDEIQLTAEDEEALSMFMPQQKMGRRTLADYINEAIEAKAATDAAAKKGNGEEAPKVDTKLDPKLVNVYSQVAKFMQHYSSGKIPLAFKIIPTLKNWEQVLHITAPEKWSAQAMFQATRVFASNLNQKMAQRFYSLVLVQRIREDVAKHKRLNFHLYQAAKKAIYKPNAFFQGILLPLCKEGMTVRESVIICSVLNKCSIPVLHAAVAISKLAQYNVGENFSGTTTLVLKTLLNKKIQFAF
eukprot:TRINITY_DN1715_c0_g1_i1.p1 TRINITY_DN1715_c0_g1~~TRINITY_DN1715_c0_g1_i1.p1  ORF type:complete len:445 (-),score=171.04 TRINITY_DN1715_c0_g1_i1:294-1628(-)